MLRPADESPWGLGSGLAFGAACVLLVLIFDGQYLFSDRVGILDWPKELFYFHYLRGSLVEFGELPVSFFTTPPALTQFSTLQDLSYWSNPEVVTLSPFLPLLWVVPTIVFIKLYFSAHFLLGIAGTGLLAKRLGFSPVEGVALFVLLALNPWLSQHLAIGYTPYICSLLFPILTALLLPPARSPFQLALAALVNAMIFYQGALHLFVWFNLAALLAGLLTAAHVRSLRPLWRVIWVQALTFALVFPKYWAVSQAYQDFIRWPGGGYSSLADLWGLLTDGTSPLFDFPAAYSRYGVAFYDASLCLGAWFIVLVAVGSVAWFLPRPSRRSGLAFPGWILAGCALVFLLLGWGGNWARLTRLLPLLASEIYPFRWLYMAFLFAAVFTLGGLVRFAGLFSGPWARPLMLLLLLPTFIGFYQRNAVFAEVNVLEEDVFAGFSLKEYLTHRAVSYSGETLLPATVTPSGLALIPPGGEGDAIWLPWLEPWRLREFEFVNARPDIFQPSSSTVLLTTLPFRPAIIRAKTHSRGILGMASVILFCLMNAFALRANARAERAGQGRRLLLLA